MNLILLKKKFIQRKRHLTKKIYEDVLFSCSHISSGQKLKVSSVDNKSNSNQASSIFDEVQVEGIDRAGGKLWCTCGCCQEENREIDCLEMYCKEVSAIDEVKFEGISTCILTINAQKFSI